MRNLLTIALFLVSATTAAAEETVPAGPPPTADANPNLPKYIFRGYPNAGSTEEPASGYLSVVIGRIGSELRNDNMNRGPSKNSGWCYGMSARLEVLNKVTVYGGLFGASVDIDVFLTTPGVVDAPQQPKGGIFFLGITPGLQLGLVKRGSFSLAAEVGAPFNTDFAGASLGTVLKWGPLYVSYRFRSGMTWHYDEVLDERVRIGLSGRAEKGVIAKGFFGIEVIDGYAEDDMGRGDLRTMFRGSYTSISLVVSKGR